MKTITVALLAITLLRGGVPQGFAEQDVPKKFRRDIQWVRIWEQTDAMRTTYRGRDGNETKREVGFGRRDCDRAEKLAAKSKYPPLRERATALFESKRCAHLRETVWPKREPKSDLEDIEMIGSRDVTGTGFFQYYTMKQEIALGRRYARELEVSWEIVDDPIIAEYVNRLSQNIARNSDLRVPLTAKVVNDPSINAAALPGGFIYINTGLLTFVDSEAELAGVIGHEIAHVAGRHSTREQSKRIFAAQLTAAVASSLLDTNSFLAVFGATILADVVLPMTTLKFSRTFEKKADYLGVQYAFKSGYDPSEIISFFEKATAEKKRSGSRVHPAFSSHPADPKRASQVSKLINDLLPPRPSYSVTSAEFKRVQARVAKLYGPTENGDRPTIIRNTDR